MNKSELLKLVDSLAFPVGDYYVLGGGCLVIRGIRAETRDLDLCVSKKLFAKIKEEYHLDSSCRNEKGFYSISPLVEFAVEGVYPFEFDIVDSYPVQKLETLLQNKQHSGREKDKRDVILIHEFLRKKNTP